MFHPVIKILIFYSTSNARGKLSIRETSSRLWSVLGMKRSFSIICKNSTFRTPSSLGGKLTKLATSRHPAEPFRSSRKIHRLNQFAYRRPGSSRLFPICSAAQRMPIPHGAPQKEGFAFSSRINNVCHSLLRLPYPPCKCAFSSGTSRDEERENKK